MGLESLHFGRSSPDCFLAPFRDPLMKHDKIPVVLWETGYRRGLWIWPQDQCPWYAMVSWLGDLIWVHPTFQALFSWSANPYDPVWDGWRHPTADSPCSRRSWNRCLRLVISRWGWRIGRVWREVSFAHNNHCTRHKRNPVEGEASWGFTISEITRWSQAVWITKRVGEAMVDISNGLESCYLQNAWILCLIDSSVGFDTAHCSSAQSERQYVLENSHWTQTIIGPLTTKALCVAQYILRNTTQWNKPAGQTPRCSSVCFVSIYCSETLSGGRKSISDGTKFSRWNSDVYTTALLQTR